MSQYFGWELLFATVENEVRSREELMVVVFHWLMIRENYLCLGTGNEVNLRFPSEKKFLLSRPFPPTERHFGRGRCF